MNGTSTYEKTDDVGVWLMSGLIVTTGFAILTVSIAAWLFVDYVATFVLDKPERIAMHMVIGFFLLIAFCRYFVTERLIRAWL